MTMERILESRSRSVRLSQSDPYYPNGRAKFTARLVQLGTQPAYFSVQGEVIPYRCKSVRACGCLHEMAERLWPQVHSIIALHLSNGNGEPMHAVENGWYALAGYYGGLGEQYHAGNSSRYGDDANIDPAEYSIERFARHVRLPVADCKSLADRWMAEADIETAGVPEVARPAEMARRIRAKFEAWIETQRPRWAAEARDAIVWLKSLPHFEEV